ncbi:reverse transcriptase domain-containing protein [Rhodopila sp.]|uniref:reverse transcriptase domain-containing protein n=1 Tax=Rhodopila sp. TaxID=2480087 RepID=UPI003D0D0D16
MGQFSTGVDNRIVDRNVLRLIKLWLQVPVEERDGDGKRRMSGGKSNTRGTPQGGVASPLLSVIYMNRFLKHWRLTGRGEAFRAHVICYADDFIILSRGHAEEALTWTKAVMTKLGLTLNEAKTSVKNARREGFDFLGYTLGPRHLPNGGRWYLGASPSKKSVQRVKVKVGELLVPGNKGAWDEVRARLNRVLRGWSAYFSYGALASAYETVDQHVYDRTRHFLRQRHKVQARGTDQFSRDHVYGELAVRSLRRERSRSSPWALR